MRHLTYIISIIMFFITSCGTIVSTGSRFEGKNKTDNNNSSVIKKSDTLSLNEDFDITPFKTRIDLIDSIPHRVLTRNNGLKAWYDYDTITSNRESGRLIKQVAGFRVLVFTTDNLEEANNMKSEIYFKTDQKPVYVSFEPPFYKIKAGDFLNSTEASEFGFKLNQMGYTESRIIRDSVNIIQ
jgi:hypothetical protein